MERHHLCLNIISRHYVPHCSQCWGHHLIVIVPEEDTEGTGGQRDRPVSIQQRKPQVQEQHICMALCVKCKTNLQGLLFLQQFRWWWWFSFSGACCCCAIWTQQAGIVYSRESGLLSIQRHRLPSVDSATTSLPGNGLVLVQQVIRFLSNFVRALILRS